MRVRIKLVTGTRKRSYAIGPGSQSAYPVISSSAIAIARRRRSFQAPRSIKAKPRI
jgi:hypothetical protein